MAKDCLALQKIQARIAKEVFHALYASASEYVDRNGNSLGDGLFSTITFAERNVTAEIHGRHISQEEYLLLESTGKGRFVVRCHVLILDCQNQRYTGECKASLANSPL